jgi:hypothetical protein
MAGRQSAATERALARIRAGATPHAAALAEGIRPNTIYRALKRERERTTTSPA